MSAFATLFSSALGIAAFSATTSLSATASRKASRAPMRFLRSATLSRAALSSLSLAPAACACWMTSSNSFGAVTTPITTCNLRRVRVLSSSSSLASSCTVTSSQALSSSSAATTSIIAAVFTLPLPLSLALAPAFFFAPAADFFFDEAFSAAAGAFFFEAAGADFFLGVFEATGDAVVDSVSLGVMGASLGAGSSRFGASCAAVGVAASGCSSSASSSESSNVPTPPASTRVLSSLWWSKFFA
mmetsp:Transcript_97032/g.279257  ORF Transcript_97032/g.279257 Transcript_97032/m.279257 type:complete len:243 (+) Transcript_97032:1430-2158(+)